jgi:hypothetical protein
MYTHWRSLKVIGFCCFFDGYSLSLRISETSSLWPKEIFTNHYLSALDGINLAPCKTHGVIDLVDENPRVI